MLSPHFLPSGAPQKLGFDADRLERLHRGMKRFVETGRHAGVSLLLVRDGQIADTFATGFRNREMDLPMTRDTIVRIYSMTKIVVSVAALTLLEEGKLGLLDPVTEYLSQFRDLRVFAGGTARDPKLVPLERPLTIQHLFTHTSGFIYEAPGEPIEEFYRPVYEEHCESLEHLVNLLARVPLKWQPGIQFEYGFSTDILGRVVEIVSGQRLDQFLNERVLGPLKMSDTGYSVDASRKERLANVYEQGTDGALHPVQSLRGELVEGERDYPAGGGGLFSTLDDYARFAQMLCNQGELEGVRTIGRKTWELMVANHLADTSMGSNNLRPGYGFGLGVSIRLDNGLAGTLGTIGSFGWAGMATTYCRIDPVESFVGLVFAQHLPYDEHGLFQRFANLAYQALV
jgi:CubicO group peptidase (beta-lactamase class C family)